MTARLQAMAQDPANKGAQKYKEGFGKVVIHENSLQEPYKWKKPKVVFVNSMSDLFHEDVPGEFIQAVFDVMASNPQHTFQVLTKRSKDMMYMDYCQQLQRSPNIQMGVSVENEDALERVQHLKQTKFLTKFLSCEPLLGPLPNLDLEGIDWVIVGGESGPNARPMDPEWVREIRDKCEAAQVPFFFKQWGGKNKKAAGRLLDGREYNQFPLGEFRLAGDSIPTNTH